MDTMPDDAIARVEELQRKITDEAVHGALRIAGLVSTSVFLLPISFGRMETEPLQAGVLATNGYLVCISSTLERLTAS